jgi:hypothetical protein
MPSSKKPCPKCGVPIKKISLSCIKCAGIRHRTPKEDKLAKGREWRKEKLAEFKKKAFDKLGAFCLNCGFNDPRALHIDHVKEDGNQERRLFKSSEGYIKYKRILEDRSGRYQVLCANCNMIKSYARIVSGNKGENCVIKRNAVGPRIDCPSGLGNI